MGIIPGVAVFGAVLIIGVRMWVKHGKPNCPYNLRRLTHAENLWRGRNGLSGPALARREQECWNSLDVVAKSHGHPREAYEHKDFDDAVDWLRTKVLTESKKQRAASGQLQKDHQRAAQLLESVIESLFDVSACPDVTPLSFGALWHYQRDIIALCDTYQVEHSSDSPAAPLLRTVLEQIEQEKQEAAVRPAQQGA